ncbi:DHS-like NAD/FAD-binding domain-containing protein [Scheffersomyces xylosifermentans]|uniref:DHS-like NAD/FAD-binding domain-containing protein n=1 Tax=Scheffersomyces xylosifermentans TaxID=1304137 RepID=UPI00315DF5A6
MASLQSASSQLEVQLSPLSPSSSLPPSTSSRAPRTGVSVAAIRSSASPAPTSSKINKARSSVGHKKYINTTNLNLLNAINKSTSMTTLGVGNNIGSSSSSASDTNTNRFSTNNHSSLPSSPESSDNVQVASSGDIHSEPKIDTPHPKSESHINTTTTNNATKLITNSNVDTASNNTITTKTKFKSTNSTNNKNTPNNANANATTKPRPRGRPPLNKNVKKQTTSRPKKPAPGTENIMTYVPDPRLTAFYRHHLRERGLMQFLHDFIPDTTSRYDLCKLLINLGYPREAISDYKVLTTKQVASILVRLILKDTSVNQDYNAFANYQAPTNTYTIDNLLSDLKSAKRIMIVSGAGISTSLGIPDFRSFKGLYAQLEHLNLKDPQKVFDMQAFQKDPGVFYSIAHLVLPPEGKYSMLHSFIKLLQDKDKLLRNYTQNIDNLEARAGIEPEKLIQCHGSFGSASCLTCRNRFAGHKIFDHIRHQHVPRCSTCWKTVQEAVITHGVIKPDITFFGEDLPKRFYGLLEPDCKSCDLVLVIGTSLKVEPVASIIDKVPRKTPRILINKDPLPDRDFDLSLIGYCDDVVSYLSQHLGESWKIPHPSYDDKATFKATPHESYKNSYRIEKK